NKLFSRNLRAVPGSGERRTGKNCSNLYIVFCQFISQYIIKTEQGQFSYSITTGIFLNLLTRCRTDVYNMAGSLCTHLPTYIFTEVIGTAEIYLQLLLETIIIFIQETPRNKHPRVIYQQVYLL